MDKRKQSFHTIISGQTPVLVDFYADWCMPCKMLSPILKDLSLDMGKNLRVLKINIDKNQEIATKFGVFSVPTILLFQNGKIIWKGSGARPKEELKRIVLSKSSVVN